MLPWDLERRPRVRGCGTAIVDMGAYEWGRCDGDATGDGLIDGADLAIVLGHWGTCSSTPCWGDLDCSGTVDGVDIAIVLGHWGTCDDEPAGTCRETAEESSRMAMGPESTGPTPEAVAEQLGFENATAFIAWLLELEFEEMETILEEVFGM